MGIEENKAVVRRWVEVTNAKDLEAPGKEARRQLAPGQRHRTPMVFARLARALPR